MNFIQGQSEGEGGPCLLTILVLLGYVFYKKDTSKIHNEKPDKQETKATSLTYMFILMYIYSIYCI